MELAKRDLGHTLYRERKDRTEVAATKKNQKLRKRGSPRERFAPGSTGKPANEPLKKVQKAVGDVTQEAPKLKAAPGNALDPSKQCRGEKAIRKIAEKKQLPGRPDGGVGGVGGGGEQKGPKKALKRLKKDVVSVAYGTLCPLDRLARSPEKKGKR